MLLSLSTEDIIEMQHSPSLYSRLGVSKSSDKSLIDQSCRLMKVKVHPDKIGDIHDELYDLEEACENLKDDALRSYYDIMGLTQHQRKERVRTMNPNERWWDFFLRFIDAYALAFSIFTMHWAAMRMTFVGVDTRSAGVFALMYDATTSSKVGVKAITCTEASSIRSAVLLMSLVWSTSLILIVTFVERQYIGYCAGSFYVLNHLKDCGYLAEDFNSCLAKLFLISVDTLKTGDAHHASCGHPICKSFRKAQDIPLEFGSAAISRHLSQNGKVIDAYLNHWKMYMVVTLISSIVSTIFVINAQMTAYAWDS